MNLERGDLVAINRGLPEQTRFGVVTGGPFGEGEGLAVEVQLQGETERRLELVSRLSPATQQELNEWRSRHAQTDPPAHS